MKIEESEHIQLKHSKISFYFGDYYFFEKFIVGEIKEGIHFNLIKVIQVNDKIYNHYGQDFKITYIANRINSYSTDPQTWSKLQERGENFLIAAALVIYNDIGFKVAAVEKQISKTYIKRCNHLDEAINWALQVNS
ncbi:MAG: hypothetical protein COB12_09040 [Flavobacterium sp.]|nr:MAG: hypothetical protein COB12_09040 [Flavobacterium sp.]